MNNKFIIKFSKPFHGWLPVEINCNDIILKFDASDVPIDPLPLLINALDSALCHSGAEVWWHLEPAGYRLYWTGITIANYLQVIRQFATVICVWI